MRLCVFARPVHHQAFPLAAAPDGPLSACAGYTPTPNPMDEFALEAALSFREHPSAPGAEVVLCSAGEQSASEPVLRELLACGADRAAWVPLHGRGPDGEGVARKLLAFFRSYAVDLALFGVSDTDTESGEVGPMFSALSGVPYLSPVVDLRPAGPGRVEVTRKEGRLREEIRTALPVCLGVLRGRPLRYPSYWGRRRAARARIDRFESDPYTRRVERLKIAGSKPRRSAGPGMDASGSSADRIRQALGVSAGKAGERDRIEGAPDAVARAILLALRRENLWTPDRG